jgi:hemoglobin/transferrin/lactoferrin receptor protein
MLSDNEGFVDLSLFADEELLFFKHLRYKHFQLTKKEAAIGTIRLTEKENYLPPVFYDYPLRYVVIADDEPGQIESIPNEIVKLENPPTSADMLQNTGSILVQKSQGGGGSPIIRGFEANKLLLVIDGVRMNNAIYRSGHLQNSITIDASILDHTEIIFGPSSSLYGSDALGGVIHFHTKDPKIIHKDSSYFEGSSYIRYNSNNNSLSGHFDFSTGKNNWAILSSFTASKFGDLVMGKNRVLHGDSTWGYHPYTSGLVGGTDVMEVNGNQNLQVGTAYSQFDLLEKIVYQKNDRMKLTLNMQYSSSSKINRYDKLTEYDNGELKYAEWYYGPQTRFLGQLKIDFDKANTSGYGSTEGVKKKGLYNKGALSIAYQRIDEDRISRRFQSLSTLNQEEDLSIFSLNLDFNKVFLKSRALFYGIEAQHNIVASSAYYELAPTNERFNAQTRYPEKSQYLSTGFYIEYKQRIRRKISFTTGLRYSIIYGKSEFLDTSFLSLPFTEVELFTSAPSGNIGLVFKPDSVSNFKINATSGFRAPNIDDYGKVFEKKGFTVVPNNNLKPELALGGELSANRTFGKEFLTVGGAFYTTYLFNAMVQRDFTLNGLDSIVYDGETTKVQAIVNTDNAIVYGVNASVQLNFSEHLKFNYTYNYTKGIDITANTPMEHIPPQFGKIALSYSNEKLNTSLFTFYNFRKRFSDYSANGDNIDLTPNEEGTPPWWTLNYRISYTFLDAITAQFAVENILDMHYRQFASGISASGRNFMFGLRADF